MILWQPHRRNERHRLLARCIGASIARRTIRNNSVTPLVTWKFSFLHSREWWWPETERKNRNCTSVRYCFNRGKLNRCLETTDEQRPLYSHCRDVFRDHYFSLQITRFCRELDQVTQLQYENDAISALMKEFYQHACSSFVCWISQVYINSLKTYERSEIWDFLWRIHRHKLEKRETRCKLEHENSIPSWITVSKARRKFMGAP